MAKSLSAHKNTIERKRKRDLTEDIAGCAKMAKDGDVRAYAFVMIGSDGGAKCCWDTGSIMPALSFAPTIFECLKRSVEEYDFEETWKPPLPIRG